MLKPATSKMAAHHIARWDSVLKNASLELARILIDHYESSEKSLRNTEKQIRMSPELTSREIGLLQEYEHKKSKEIGLVKSKKFRRDGIVQPATAEQQLDVGVSKEREPILQSACPENSCIVNLSCATLSPAELSLLSRGLSFCPATGGFNEFSLFKDLDNFCRNLRLREYFHDRPSHIETLDPLPSHKHWTPPTQRDKYLDMYISAVTRDILDAYKKQAPYRKNLSADESNALKLLATHPEIIIKPADKGGAIVVMNKTDYINEALRQLSDSSFYKRVDADPTEEFNATIKETLQNLAQANKVAPDAIKALVPLSPVAGRFYLLPKIHKKDNPGRPIVSGIGTVTEKLSLYVDSLINNIPPKFPSFVKDTNHFLNDIIELCIPPGSLLVTLDVTSLYTNIPHDDGIRAVVETYEAFCESSPVDGDTLATLLKLILELNNFEFDNAHYIQINGTSMGTRVGPSYANIFMCSLETAYLDKCTLKPFYYKRFIDDVFLIWPHGEHELLSFISGFNNCHPRISFSHQYSAEAINFLDVTVSVKDARLTTNLYRKPTDRHQYLHFESSHVKHNKTSIPYSQAVRFKRICSQESDFNQNCAVLRAALTRQKYPTQIIDDAVRRASMLDRNALLCPMTQPRTQQTTNLVLSYSSSAPKVTSILKKHHNILMQSQRLQRIFQDPPRVVYRRSANLRDSLTSSKTTHPSCTGCQPCQKPRCQICPQMTTTVTASSTTSNFTLNIKGNFTCDTENVIYLLECTECRLQYIGQTRKSFRLRFNNHKSHIKTLPNLPLSHHINVVGHSFNKIKATILESGFRSHHDREVRESYLIHKFKSMKSGLNESVGALAFLSH